VDQLTFNLKQLTIQLRMNNWVPQIEEDTGYENDKIDDHDIFFSTNLVDELALMCQFSPVVCDIMCSHSRGANEMPFKLL